MLRITVEGETNRTATERPTTTRTRTTKPMTRNTNAANDDAQNTSYPDPKQLEAYAREPMPFHEITPSDLGLIRGWKLRSEAEHVAYEYHPTYIMVETERDEYTDASDVPGFDLSHAYAWNRAMDVEIQEDYICVSDLVTGPDGETHKYDAYWVLESVTFENPKLYADADNAEVSDE